MFLDDVIAKLGKPMQALDSSCSDGEAKRLLKQLKDCLHVQCPRFDIHNVRTVLFPDIIKPAVPNPEVDKRNAELLEKREDFMELVEKALLTFPYSFFWVEYRMDVQRRAGCLVRATDNGGTTVTQYEGWDKIFKCTTVIESTDGRIEFTPDAFTIILEPTKDTYVSVDYDPYVTQFGVRKDFTAEMAQCVRASVALRNWDSDDIPTFVQPVGKPRHGKNGEKKPTKSEPTIIKFEPFLKKMRQRRSGTPDSTGQEMPWHLRRAHYANYTWGAPLFGRKPVLGKTVGRIYIPQCHVNKGKGKFKTTVGMVVVGEVKNPAGWTPMFPFSAAKEIE